MYIYIKKKQIIIIPFKEKFDLFSLSGTYHFILSEENIFCTFAKCPPKAAACETATSYVYSLQFGGSCTAVSPRGPKEAI